MARAFVALGGLLTTRPRRVAEVEQVQGLPLQDGGVVTSRKPGSAESAGAMVLRQMVPRSARRVAKLCTGRASRSPGVICEIAWILICDPGARYQELGPDYCRPRSRARQTRDKIREIERLNPGKKVILAPIDADADTAA